MLDWFKKKKADPVIKQNTGTITLSIMYTYEWQEEVPPNERDCVKCNSVGFCQKLMDLKRFYTRADIEKISARLGYSVWDRRGGDDCKHYWKSNQVIKKKGVQDAVFCN